MSLGLLFPEEKRPAILDTWNLEHGGRRLAPISEQGGIAISGKSGCGNSTLCALLAERLRIEKINYTFRNLSQEMGVSLEEITKRASHDHSIDWFIDNRLSLLILRGGIIGSRLAVWLAPSSIFRVYLNVSLDVRVQRIAQRERKPLDVVYEDTCVRDRADEGRYKKLYGIDVNDYQFVDVVMDYDDYTPNEMADMVMDAFSKMLEETSPTRKS